MATEEQAKSALGVSPEMSSQDFFSALTASLTEPINEFKKLIKEESQQEKQAKEQLKQMKVLSDGLEEVTDVVKKIVELGKKKVGEKQGTSINDVAKALNNMSSGNTMPKLEETTYKKMAKMADAALQNHSLGVKDTVLWAKMDSLIGAISRMHNDIVSALGSRGGRRTASEDPGSFSGRRSLGSVGADDKDFSIREATKPGEASAIPQEGQVDDANKKLDITKNLYDQLLKRSKGWADKLHIADDTMKSIISHANQAYDGDNKIAQAMNEVLGHMSKMDRYEQKKLIDKAKEIQKLKEQISLGNDVVDNQKRLNDSMDEFIYKIEFAGEKMKINFTDKISNIKGKVDALNRAISYFNPSEYGVLPKFSATDSAQRGVKERAQYIAEFNQILFQAAGSAEEALVEKLRDDVLNFSKESLFSTEVIAKAQAKAMRRGVTDEKQFVSLTKTGLSLSRLIGSNAEATSDEILTWAQRYDMTNVQVATLSRNVQSVGRLTGVTGDNLLNSVKSARELADAMRNVGTFTDKSNKSLIQFNAAAQKHGTEAQMNPVLRALATASGFLEADSRVQSLLLRTASLSSNPRLARQNLMAGATLDSDEGKKLQLEGHQNLLSRYLNQYAKSSGVGTASSSEELRQKLIDKEISQRAPGVSEAEARAKGLRKFSDINRTVAAQTQGMGLGGLERQIATFKDATMTASEKLTEAENKLAEARKQSTNSTKGEVKSLTERRDILQRDVSMGLLDDVDQRARTGPSISMNAAEQDALRKMAAQAGITNGDRITKALTNPETFRQLYEDIVKNLEGKRLQESTITDPITKGIAELNATSVKIQDAAEKGFQKLINELGPKAFVDAAKIAGIGQDVSKILDALQNIGGALLPLGGALGISQGGAGGLTNKAGSAGLLKSAAGVAVGLAAAYAVDTYLGPTIKKWGDEVGLLGLKGDALQAGADSAGAFLSTLAITGDPALGMFTALIVTGKKLNDAYQSYADRIEKEEAKNKLRDFQLSEEKELLKPENLAKMTKEQRDQTEKMISEVIPQLENDLKWLPEELKKWHTPRDRANLEKKLSTAQEHHDFAIQTQKALQVLKENPNAFKQGTISENASEVYKDNPTAMDVLAGKTMADKQKSIENAEAKIQDLEMPKPAGEQEYDELLAARTEAKKLESQLKLAKELYEKQKSEQANAMHIIGNRDYVPRRADDATGGAMSRYSPLSVATQRASINSPIDAAIYQSTYKSLSQMKDKKSFDEFVASKRADLQSRYKNTEPTLEGEVTAANIARESAAFEKAVSQAMTDNKNLDNINTNTAPLLKGDKPGSFYTHDIHVESLLDDFLSEIAIVRPDISEPDAIEAKTSPELNEEMIKQRIRTEFVGEPGGSIAEANQTLDDISKSNRLQVDLLKDEIEILRQILTAVTIRGSAPTSTTSNIKPAIPPNYNDWSIRQINSPNYGHTENFSRG